MKAIKDYLGDQVTRVELCVVSNSKIAKAACSWLFSRVYFLERKNNMKKQLYWFGFLIFLILGLMVGVTKPFQLEPQGHSILMMLVFTLGLWILKPLGIPFSITSALFMASMLAIGLPSNIVFSGFTGPAVWVLIPALFFGFVLAKTGLGKRIALLGMKYTKLSYGGLLFMWVIIGVVLSTLTPSITVRVVIIIPIALNCVNICRLSEGSKGRSLILLTAWAMALIPGTAWLSGSLGGPILNGFFSAVPGLGPISFNDWVKVSFLPVAILTLLTVLGGYLALKPSEPLKLTKEIFAEEYQKLGPMTRQEKFTSFILAAAFLMFLTNSLHHIPDPATCLFALFLLTAAGIIQAKEVSTGINWDLVIFIGTAMGLSTIFTQSGIAKWISSILVTAMAPIAGNPYAFMYMAIIAMFMIRFVDIATFIPSMAILSAVLPQIAAAYGINPLVWIPLFTMSINVFFLTYQNMFALVAESNLAGKGWAARHFSIYGTVYFIAVLITMLAAIPYWSSIGMFG
jgi:anion transporter